MVTDLKTLLSFLIQWCFTLLQPPIDGSLMYTYELFLKNSPLNLISKDQFVSAIYEINDLTGNSIEFDDCRSGKISWINKLSLIFLYDQLELKGSSMVLKPSEVSDGLGILQLLQWKDKSNNIFNMTTRKSQLSTLNDLLNKETCLPRLKRDKLNHTKRKQGPSQPFYEICQDQDHIKKLLSLLGNKINEADIVPSVISDTQLSRCLYTKIHNLPLIRPQSDVKLGDCSYLDTCHKFNTCRYLHYKQLTPDQSIRANDGAGIAEEPRYLSDFTLGEPIGQLTRDTAPAQWINCDIRKLDFEILGKFAAIVADPPWNIHMVLPYGTCNDSELFNLPVSVLQDEGLFLLWVTGRSIEVGRESLAKWGYKIIDEMIWIKTNQLSRSICTGRTGHWLNHSKEHLLIGMKGNPKWAISGVDTDVIVSGTRETSRKPDEIYDIVERMVGVKSRKLEIFGRDHNTRPGWLTIGNQLNGDSILEPDLKSRYQNFKKTQKSRELSSAQLR